MDLTPFIVAAMVAIPAMLATSLVPLLIRRSERMERRANREEDKKDLREAKEAAERVAREAKTAAKDVAAAALEAAQTVAANTAEAVNAAKETNQKLVEVAKVQNTIHTLVNSQLTESKQSEYGAWTRTVILLREKEPTPEILTEIAAAEVRLAELVVVLSDRKAAQRTVETQQKLQEKI